MSTPRKNNSSTKPIVENTEKTYVYFEIVNNNVELLNEGRSVTEDYIKDDVENDYVETNSPYYRFNINDLIIERVEFEKNISIKVIK